MLIRMVIKIKELRRNFYTDIHWLETSLMLPKSHKTRQ